jgi:hypothetical protein
VLIFFGPESKQSAWQKKNRKEKMEKRMNREYLSSPIISIERLAQKWPSKIHSQRTKNQPSKQTTRSITRYKKVKV